MAEIWQSVAGSPAGTYGFTDGDGDEARFNGPLSICFDPTYTYAYVADRYNNAIRRIDFSNGLFTVETFATTNEWVNYVHYDSYDDTIWATTYNPSAGVQRSYVYQWALDGTLLFSIGGGTGSGYGYGCIKSLYTLGVNLTILKGPVNAFHSGWGYLDTGSGAINFDLTCMAPGVLVHHDDGAYPGLNCGFDYLDYLGTKYKVNWHDYVYPSSSGLCMNHIHDQYCRGPLDTPITTHDAFHNGNLGDLIVPNSPHEIEITETETSGYYTLNATCYNNSHGAYHTFDIDMTLDVIDNEQFYGPAYSWANGVAYNGTMDKLFFTLGRRTTANYSGADCNQIAFLRPDGVGWSSYIPKKKR